MFVITGSTVYNVVKTEEEITLQKLEVWAPRTRPRPYKFTWKGDTISDEENHYLRLFVDGKEVYCDGRIIRVTDTLKEEDLVIMYRDRP